MKVTCKRCEKELATKGSLIGHLQKKKLCSPSKPENDIPVDKYLAELSGIAPPASAPTTPAPSKPASAPTTPAPSKPASVPTTPAPTTPAPTTPAPTTPAPSKPASAPTTTATAPPSVVAGTDGKKSDEDDAITRALNSIEYTPEFKKHIRNLIIKSIFEVLENDIHRHFEENKDNLFESVNIPADKKKMVMYRIHQNLEITLNWVRGFVFTSTNLIDEQIEKK